MAQDLFLFYIFFEGRPDPDVPDHRHLGRRATASTRSYKFFLYTLLGSVLMLIAMLWMAHDAGTTDIPR